MSCTQVHPCDIKLHHMCIDFAAWQQHACSGIGKETAAALARRGAKGEAAASS